MQKCRKRPCNLYHRLDYQPLFEKMSPHSLYQYKNSLLKTNFPWLQSIQNIPQVSSETSMPRLVQNKPSALICREENKVEFLGRQFHSEKLSFVHRKETEHSFELSHSIWVFYRRIFNLEIQNFGLKNHHLMNTRQPFCWWMTFAKVPNPPLLPSLIWLTMWLLGGGGGGGGEWMIYFG